MANNDIPNGGIILFKGIEEDNRNQIDSPSQAHDNLINALPVKLYGPGQLRLHQGFWFSENILRGVLKMQQNFQSRATDIFLASYLKSGTTWLKALMFSIVTRSSVPLHQNPLLAHNPHQCVPSMDLLFSTSQSSVIEAMHSPRILSSHLPCSLLPDSITHSGCPIIYICRDPKDVLVSMYHFICEFREEAKCKASFEEIFETYCDGVSGFGPVWDHVVGYWQESVRDPTKILFLKYEDMLLEPTEHVKRLAKFINYPFSEEEEHNGVVERIVDLCSFQKLRDLDVNKTGESKMNKDISNAVFFRKGVVGDWRNHMTPEMAQRLDDITELKFKGCGLEIRSTRRELDANYVE